MARWLNVNFFRRRNQIPKGFKVLKKGKVFSSSYKRVLEQRNNLLQKYGVPKKEIELLMRDWPVVKAALMADTVRGNCSVNVAKHILDLMLAKRKGWINAWVEHSKQVDAVFSEKESRQDGAEKYDHLLRAVSMAIEKAQPTPDRKAENWGAMDNVESRVRNIDHLLLPVEQRNSEIIILPKMALLVTGEFIATDLKRILGNKYDAFVKEDAALHR